MAGTSPSNEFKVLVGGNDLPDAIETLLVSALVEDNLHAPDVFQLTFNDQERTVLEKGGFEIGTKVKIKVVSEGYPSGVVLIEGEVTSLEAEYDNGSFTTVRGLDVSHKLFAGRGTYVYKNVTYGDVVRKVLSRAGVPTGTIDATQPVHDLVTQANMSDWQFLAGLALETGFNMGCNDGKFNFTKPPDAAKGPKPGSTRSASPLELVLGQNLLRFRTTVSSVEQVPSVQVRGWDVKKKEAVIGEAPAKTVSAQIGITPAQIAGKTKAKPFKSVHTPFDNQKEVENVAKALANQIASSFAEMEGLAIGDPNLQAGSLVSLGLVGAPFDGKYTITSSRHTYNHSDGYRVFFTVSGQQERSLLGMMSGGGSSSNGVGSPGQPIHGVAIGIVADNNDPDKLGRVKVKLPWLDNDYESFWARVAFHGAGKDRGMVILPEVNDEVLVAFEHGDARRPYVLGGLWNGKDKPNLGNAGDLLSSGKVNRRGFVSAAGHKIVFLDGPKKGVLVATKDNKYRLSLNETKATIRIISDGKLELDAKQDIMISTKANVNVDAKGNVKMSAKGNLDVDAMKVSINAKGDMELKGMVIKLN